MDLSMESVVSAISERRKAVRQPVTEAESVALDLEGGSGKVQGFLLDLSEEGAGLRVAVQAESLEPGTVLNVRMEKPPITRRALVCWTRAEETGWRLGIRFLKPCAFDPQNHTLDIEHARIDPDCVLKIPAPMAMRRKVLPFARLDGVVHVACAEPDCRSTVRVMEKMFKAPVVTWATDAEVLDRVVRRVFGDGRSIPTHTALQPLQNLDADAVTLSEEILYAAYLKRASDIHLDPTPEGVRVRLRVDGQLETYAMLPSAVHSELIGRLKVLAGMDIAEKRAPQDGSFTKSFSSDRPIDFRVATLPTKYGERMTLRLLALDTDSLTLDRLGLSESHRLLVERFLQRNQGLMILTGPTGSGKTTTLYACIRALLERRELNVITVEDPIEYEIAGVAQAEVDSADKVSFAKALRSILRHDPDAIMIGEIRDLETADTAIKAALTGHLVFSTLHTNSAAGSITRLIDMGLAPFLVGASLRLAIAQRLVRKLCSYCRIPRRLTEREAIALGCPDLAGSTVYEGVGCIYCGGIGYRGRTGVYEVLEVDEERARRIAEGAKESEIIAWMRAQKIPLLMDDALEKLFAGQTSVGEVLRIALSW
jgi:type II secretory ATPase GspE/PulE/Tfp pilus assembly ATPase PilB-like protein